MNKLVFISFIIFLSIVEGFSQEKLKTITASGVVEYEHKPEYFRVYMHFINPKSPYDHLENFKKVLTQNDLDSSKVGLQTKLDIPLGRFKKRHTFFYYDANAQAEIQKLETIPFMPRVNRDKIDVHYTYNQETLVELITKASKKARQRAEILASANGANLGTLLSFTEENIDYIEHYSQDIDFMHQPRKFEVRVQFQLDPK